MKETFYEVLDRIEDEEVAVSMAAGTTSLDFLRAVYTSPDQPMQRRIRCAVAALPFEHPKLAVTATTNLDGLGAQLEAARARAAKVIELRATEPAQLAPEVLEPIRR